MHVRPDLKMALGRGTAPYTRFGRTSIIKALLHKGQMLGIVLFFLNSNICGTIDSLNSCMIF